MLRTLLILIALHICAQVHAVNAVNFTGKDSLLQVVNGKAKALDKVYACFALADAYMENERLDSTQYWLNRIYSIYKVENYSLFNYFCITRQSEVYYYDNLMHLGIQSSLKSLDIAEHLQDSILIGDACNFLGLFYLNIDSLETAIRYFRKGLLFAKEPPLPPQYLELSKPLHLYGNLAEAYEKNKQYDSSKKYSYLSLWAAEKIQKKRGMAVAWQNLGKVFTYLKQKDSALLCFKNSLDICITNKILDVELLNYSGLARLMDFNGSSAESEKYLALGFEYLNTQELINILFSRAFLKTAIEIYTKNKHTNALNQSLAHLHKVDSLSAHYNATQVEQIIQNITNAENEILKFEIEQQKQQQNSTRFMLLLALLALALIILGIVYSRYRLKQKLALANIKNRISSDLHDNLGSTLSSVKVYAELAKKVIEEKPKESSKILNKISHLSEEAIEEISDLVWAIKPQTDESASIESKIKNYGNDLLSSKNINCTYTIESPIQQQLKSAHAKRNLLSIIKEAMHNISKYSSATQATISLFEQHKQVMLNINDNGVGFDMDKIKKGNGLNNIQNRCKLMQGWLEVKTAPGQGTHIACGFPITIFSDENFSLPM